jgi:apolipoprotein N-acyltransferase
MPSGAMIQFASLFGVYGLTWVTVLAASAPAAMADGKAAWRGVVVSWLVLPVIALGGAIRLGDAEIFDVPDVRLRLVQANIAQFHKWRDDLREQNLQTHLTMSAAPPAVETDPPPTHIIWPETAVPYLLATEPMIRDRIAQVVPKGGAVMTGAVRAEPQDDGNTQVWNSFHAVDADGVVIATYDKFHLVPFGEYTPLRSVLKIAKLTEGTTDFSSGPGPQSMAIAGLPLVSPLICYEAIFPGDVVQADVRPGWLLNVTNDAWYGISSGPYQHFQQARLRAVEEGLPIVRVANTGISGVVDPYGRVRQALGLGESGILDANLPQPIPDPTVYGRWRDWPVLVVLILSLAWAGNRARAKKRLKST